MVWNFDGYIVTPIAAHLPDRVEATDPIMLHVHTRNLAVSLCPVVMSIRDLYVFHRAYFANIKIDQQIHTQFTITYLCQNHPYMFRRSSHHPQGAQKVTGSVMHLKPYNITYKKLSSVPVYGNSRLPKSLQLKWRQFILTRTAQRE
jgi:hypothetical protein